LNVDGVDLILRHDPSLPAAGWGSYPMVPWAGRIRRGRFAFDGVDHQLPINFETHAIHGTGFEQPWAVTATDERRVELACGLSWTFGGESQQLIELGDDSLTCTLIARAGDRPMPASIGWHPWFVKPDKVDLQFARMYLRDDDYITDGRIAEPPPPPWDDCFESRSYTTHLDRRTRSVDFERLRVLGRVRHAGARDLRRASIGHSRCIQPGRRDAARTGPGVAPHHDDSLVVASSPGRDRSP
jgi:aldose 1-epimerase